MRAYEVEQESKAYKLLGLECIRFICSLSILLWHYQHFSFIGDKPTNYISAQLPFYSLLHVFYDYGYCGVQAFWCISGFIFFFNYRSIIAAKTLAPKSFFILRFSRLYPLHIVTLLLVLALQTLYFSKHGYYFVYPHNELIYFILQLFMADTKGLSFNGPIWSVAVEILIYALFFLTLRRFGKSLWVNVIVIGLCVWVDVHSRSPVFECAAFFYMGGLAAIAFRHSLTEQSRAIALGKFLALAVLIIAPVIIYRTEVYQYEIFPVIFLFLYLPVLFFLIAHYTTQSRMLTRILEAVGNMTYASYLTHFPLQLSIALVYSSLQQHIPYYSTAFLIGFVGSTLTLSYFVFHFFELPARIYIRNRFLK